MVTTTTPLQLVESNLTGMVFARLAPCAGNGLGSVFNRSVAMWWHDVQYFMARASIHRHWESSTVALLQCFVVVMEWNRTQWKLWDYKKADWSR